MNPRLVTMFNDSLNTGRIPEDWKHTTVVPIFKEVNQSDPSNYRPSSLTSIVAKLLERILRDYISAHLLQIVFLCNAQHGFIKGISCLTYLLCFLDVLTQKLDEGTEVEVCYLDFQKALDSVNHRLLDFKPRETGLNPKVGNWFRAFLSGRTYKVRVRGCLSEVGSPTNKGPQGSILGPLLLLVYVNDIISGLEKPCFLYADDIKLVKNPDDRYSLQSDILKICEWSQK
ncbi:unnamed protein product [Echinostoma caproni]|uniref:Reverse transcriptase domain-containing protein n=1 Tax=Echinostoma caproni TaxID=27848 RepID=A0A183A1T8_9TREM|nr:unnamed protein product [Echinostoma caproni]